MTAEAGPDLHVRGVVLPDGEHRDVWVRRGRLTYEPVPGAETVAAGWVLPGLVDLHCHVGLDAHGAVPDDVAERQALTDRDAGVLLIRDAGSPADTRWMDDRDDLPRIVRAGRHLARTRRYIRNYGHEFEPDELVAYVEREAVRGDGWVKLVGDWIDRDLGLLGPCWPPEALQAAIARAHELGARVTAHVFGDAALPDLVGAGIDCIEHGTGMSPDVAAEMARRGVAVVPTLVNIENFPGYADAGEARFPAYAAQMRDLHARRYNTVRTAYETGVRVYVGTDAGGVMAHGLAAREVLELVRAGLPPETAVGAGSWDARAYLLGGTGRLEEGATGDLVVVSDDPVKNPATLLDPVRVVLRGRVVR